MKWIKMPIVFKFNSSDVGLLCSTEDWCWSNYNCIEVTCENPDQSHICNGGPGTFGCQNIFECITVSCPTYLPCQPGIHDCTEYQPPAYHTR